VLRIDSVLAADEGNYAVTVTNALASVTSAVAALAIDEPPGGRLVNLSANA
jgi:hypothetical protein